MKTITANWIDIVDHTFTNVGDSSTPYLLKKFDINVIYTKENPQMYGVGSVLHMIPRDYKGFIWSSGFMFNTHELHLKNDPIALRGRLSLKQFKNNTPKRDFVYRPRFKLGVVANYADIINMRDDPLEKYKIFDSPDVLYIDVRNYIETFANQIVSCENIISSSLHGAVFADSYEINNTIFESRESKLSMHQMQSSFKFRDHYSAFDQEFHKPALYLDKNTTLEQCLSVCKPFNKPNLEAIKQGLVKSVEKLKELI